MTRIAKILVFLNLALSLTIACWAIGWYANHVDWTDSKTGVYFQLAERIKDLDTARGRAEARYAKETATLQAREKLIPELRAWYEAELESLRTGNRPPQDPVVVNGEIQLDPKGQPRMGPVLNASKKEIAGLASIAKLDNQYAQRQTEISNVAEEINKLVEQEKALTSEIGNGQAAGLRAELAAQQSEVRKSLHEQETLEPLLYNRLAELEILKKRHAALEARLKELTGTRVARNS
jgi:hypothetical protein